MEDENVQAHLAQASAWMEMAEKDDADPRLLLGAMDSCYQAVELCAADALERLNIIGVAPEDALSTLVEGIRSRVMTEYDWEPVRRSIPPRVQTMVFRRDGYVCVECGEDNVRKLTVDHRIPVHFGGSSEPDNLITRCASCNASKGKELRS